MNESLCLKTEDKKKKNSTFVHLKKLFLLSWNLYDASYQYIVIKLSMSLYWRMYKEMKKCPI